MFGTLGHYKQSSGTRLCRKGSGPVHPVVEREPVTFQFPNQIKRSTRREGRRRNATKQTATFKNVKIRLQAGGMSAGLNNGRAS